MLVLKVSYSNDRYSKLKVLWVSKWTGSVLTGTHENIKILADDYKYWTVI
jgi:hypothetical protein